MVIYDFIVRGILIHQRAYVIQRIVRTVKDRNISLVWMKQPACNNAGAFLFAYGQKGEQKLLNALCIELIPLSIAKNLGSGTRPKNLLSSPSSRVGDSPEESKNSVPSRHSEGAVGDRRIQEFRIKVAVLGCFTYVQHDEKATTKNNSLHLN